MNTRDLAQDDFIPTVTREGLVLIDWWAPWCQPCKAFDPIYARVAKDHPDVVFGKIDTEQESELAAELGIRSIPTLMVFRDGILLFAQPGLIPEPDLRQLVEQAAELDMDEVRRSIAQLPEDGPPGDGLADDGLADDDEVGNDS